MKKYFFKITLGLLSLLYLAACQKDESSIGYAGNTPPPVLTASIPNNDSVVLTAADSTNPGLILTWTNPNYSFSNGISSLNVNYTIQIDTIGSNFTNPGMVQISLSSILGESFTIGQLNFELFGGLNLKTGIPHQIAIRVESFLNQGSLPLYSNVFNYTITPYAIPPKVNPPSSGTLYVTGSATGDGWMVTGQASSVAGQQMTQVTPLLYTITMPMIGGQQFLVVPLAGDWGNKYATAESSSSPSGGTFAYNAANNFTGPTATGNYTVTFNFQTGLYTITP